MASTYEPISRNVVSGSVSTVTFTSIPSTYTDLLITAQPIIAGAGGADLRAVFNSVAAQSYDRIILGASTSSNWTASATLQNFARFNYSTPIRSDGNTTYTIHIMNYASDRYKTVLSHADRAVNATSPSTDMIVNYWRELAVINRIDFSTDGANFESGSVFSVYGIKAA